jgi:hypothetical protein
MLEVSMVAVHNFASRGKRPLQERGRVREGRMGYVYKEM